MIRHLELHLLLDHEMLYRLDQGDYDGRFSGSRVGGYLFKMGVGFFVSLMLLIY